jgi:hypothetical protein
MTTPEIIKQVLLIHSKRALIDVCVECARDYPCLTRELLLQAQEQ